MAAGSVTSTGIAELRQAIEQLPDAVTAALKEVARQTAVRELATAQRLVPVKTGYTRDHIHIVEDVAHKQYLVVAGTDAPEVRFSWHISKRTGRGHTQKVTLNMLPVWLEKGTRFMRARPFMRPASDAEQDRYRAEMDAASVATAVKVFG